MLSLFPRFRSPSVLLCAALSLAACDALREHPTPPPPPDRPQPTSPPSALTVTLTAAGPAYCKEGQVSLTATIEGGKPDRVAFLANGVDFTPYSAVGTRYDIDCATYSENHYSFVARAWAGEKTFDSSPVTVVVDRTGPVVIGWRPDTAFPTVDTPVELVFNEPVDAGSLHAPTVLRDGNGFSVAHQAVLSEDGTSLRLVPTQPLHPPVTLHAELVQSDLTDLAGNPLRSGSAREKAFDYWPFARMAPAASQLQISRFTFALKPYDNQEPFVAFTELERLSSSVELGVAHWNGSAWERLPPPSTPEEGSTVNHPQQLQLAVSWEGHPVLAWCQDGGSTARVFVKRFDGTAWQSLGAPMETGYPHCFTLRMAYGSDTNLVIAHDLRGVDLRVVRWDGKAWTQLGGPINANPGQTPVGDAAAVGVSAEEVFLAWSQRPPDVSGTRVLVWCYRNGAWAPLGEPLWGSGDGRADKVGMTVDSSGNPLVAWTEGLGTLGLNGVFFSRWKFDRWSAPEQLQGPTSSMWLSEPLLGVGFDNEPWVAWQRENNAYGGEILYRRHRFSGWDPEQLVAGGFLAGFQLDGDGYPRFGVIRSDSSEGAVLLRPQ